MNNGEASFAISGTPIGGNTLSIKEISSDLPLEKLDKLKVYYIGKNGKFTILLKLPVCQICRSCESPHADLILS